MLISKENYFQRRLRQWAWKLFAKLECIDSGGSNPHRNGEIKFINLMLEFYAKVFPNQPLQILDIGASCGEYSQNKLPVLIHLFEPLPECFRQIESKFADQVNLFLNNFGISEADTSTTIFYDQETSQLASLYRRKIDQYNIFMNKSQAIEVRRMDKYIQEKFIEHIHFVKVDVEGHELNVLKSFGDYLNGSFIDFIQFEYGETYFDAHIRLLEVYQLLTMRDFKIAKITPNGLILKSYYQYMENFIYANYVAISNRILALSL